MLRKDMKQRIAVDRRGKITTGKKSDKGYPQSLDYFNISAFPELIEEYGEKPRKLVIMFPTSRIDDFYATEYNVWGGKTGAPIKKRQCDGETCLHKVSETINGIEYLAGTVSGCICKLLPANDKQRCNCYMGLKAFVVHLDGKIHNPICYMFESHSVNTADNLFSQIANIHTLTDGRMRGVPFILTVKMVETVSDGNKHKYPIWEIQPFGSIPQIMEMSKQDVLPTTAEQSLKLEAPNEKQIEAQNQAESKDVKRLKMILLEEMGDRLMEDADGDKEKAGDVLEKATEFTGKDKKLVPGVRSIKQMTTWPFARVKIAHTKICTPQL